MSGFTVVRDQMGFTLGRRQAVAGPGQSMEAAPGVVHDWWNAGEAPAQVRVEIEPAAWFEAVIRNAFCLAQDGKTDRKGMPDLLQVALYAREFDDVIRFTRPSRLLQRLLFLLLRPVARWRGYRRSYPEYLTRPPNAVNEVRED